MIPVGNSPFAVGVFIQPAIPFKHFKAALELEIGNGINPGQLRCPR
jgi:hypothetical protein